MSTEQHLGMVKSSHGVEVEEVEGAEGITIQKLIVEKHGSKNIRMRKFTMKPGAWMVLHEHENIEHLQYFLKGKVKLTMGDEVYDVKKDDIVFIPVGAAHKYENKGDEEAQFLCIIPNKEVKTDILD
ncbi:MAG: cupin domain-containing protein [Thermoplasmata archaeon]